VHRQLTLLRHAKSSWEDASVRDRDRPLNKRGERDAPLMGHRLRAREVRPALILMSPAIRTRRTAQIVAREIGYPVEFLQQEEDLYLASAKQIVEVLARQDGSFRDIVVCGHNPGITDLANQLTGAGIDNVPTTGIVIIGLDLDRWADLAKAEGRLVLFDYPKRDSTS